MSVIDIDASIGNIDINTLTARTMIFILGDGESAGRQPRVVADARETLLCVDESYSWRKDRILNVLRADFWTFWVLTICCAQHSLLQAFPGSFGELGP
jgi:hypothetical protein